MTKKPDLDDLKKRSERSITKMSDAQALAHIGELIDDSFDLSFERALSARSIYSTNWPNDR